MPNLQASPRGDLLGFIADKLKAGKSFGNKYEILKQIPFLGGTGYNIILDNIKYGDSIF